MLREHIARGPDGRDLVTKTEEATPECGTDFCDDCGDCLACSGDLDCCGGQDGKPHRYPGGSPRGLRHGALHLHLVLWRAGGRGWARRR